MQARGSKRRLKLRPVTAASALDFGELRDDVPVPAVKVTRHGFALCLQPEPGSPLLPRGDAIVRDEPPNSRPASDLPYRNTLRVWAPLRLIINRNPRTTCP
jgi:hypothetical protein